MKFFVTLLLLVSLVLPPPASANPVPKDFDNGLKVALEAIKQLGLEEDADKVKRLNDIGYRVAQRAAPEMPYFSFRVIKMEEPNAFALPGGFIFVTTGMLDLDLTDDELAALLGHEITHVKNDHIRRMGKRQTLMNLLYQALIIGIAFGIKEDGGGGYNPVTGAPTRSAKSEILQGSAAFGLVFQELLLRGFSRELELEADRGGMAAAAGAGFSAEGTSRLFEKMRQRIYEAPGYGYWRTHPYLEDRVGIARSLSAGMETSKNPSDPAEFRQRTQKTFLDLVSSQKEEEQKTELRRMALNSCPTGKQALDLRWWFIRQAETDELKKEPFFRDYGKLIRIYEENLKELKRSSETVSPVAFEVSVSTEDSASTDFRKKVEASLKTAREEVEDTRPLYEEVLGKQAFDTEMLRRYISNSPGSRRIPEVQFRLAENYRILKKQPNAVDLYLTVLQKEGDSEWKEKSKQSLLQMLSSLEDLSSCYKITVQSKDPDLEKPAQERMKKLAESFQALQNGYEFRRNYPASSFDKPVLAQMTKLASQTLHQGKLYQAIGEYQKALDQYNQILRYCSDMPVADEVKETIVDFQELQSAKG